MAESVRRHSRQPVLLISSEHPLLEDVLPSIAEEPPLPETRLPAGRSLSAGISRSCSLSLASLPDLAPLPISRGLSSRTTMHSQRQIGLSECSKTRAVPTF